MSEPQDGGQELGLGASRLDARPQKGPDGPRSGTSDAAFGVPHRGGDASVVWNPLHRTRLCPPARDAPLPGPPWLRIRFRGDALRRSEAHS